MAPNLYADIHKGVSILYKNKNTDNSLYRRVNKSAGTSDSWSCNIITRQET